MIGVMARQEMENMEAQYRKRTPKSAKLSAAAKRVMPGGDTRTNTFFLPYPLFIERGEGCRIVDADGNTYLDLLANYTSMIHGHAHPKIVDGVMQQLSRGTTFASPLESQIQLATAICTRIPSIERVRFCNSGTEATMNAIRVAKAFTGRNKIIKMEGGYHGSHDAASVSVAPPLKKAGPSSSPHSVPDLDGVFRGVLEDVLVVPFNDVTAASKIIERNSDDLAAVIVEPVLGSGGCVPATSEFLKFLRDATQSTGALLIFDEIITSRLSVGGAQEIYRVTPDLTTLGKIIGGGFPIGAFGGKADVMAMFDPARRKLFQGGTFNGNAISMVAGLITLELLTGDEIARINNLGEQLRQGLSRTFADSPIPGQVVGIGSLLQVHFAKQPVADYRSAAAGSKDLVMLLHLALLNRGIFTSTRASLCISTPMTETEVAETVDGFKNALSELSTVVSTMA
jgi:glutamate-1-semialdehyde 2,1-aminomutase